MQKEHKKVNLLIKQIKMLEMILLMLKLLKIKLKNQNLIMNILVLINFLKKCKIDHQCFKINNNRFKLNQHNFKIHKILVK